MKVLVLLLIVINVFLGIVIVNQKNQMRKLTQEKYKEMQRETALRYEFDQWSTERNILEAELKIEYIAKNKLGMIDASSPVAVINVNNEK